MRAEVINKNRNCVFHGPYAGRDLYITMLKDTEREFVVTHNVNIKPVSYFTGRETELKDLRQRIEDGRKSVLVSGMGGIGKTQICRKLFDEYCNKQSKDKDGPFLHIGYIEYNDDMNSSLMNCLRYKEQDNPELNQEAAWRELEDLASKGKLLLFVDNVDKSVIEDSSLQRLNHIPGAIIITSRLVSFSDEFELCKIGFLDMKQCKEIYEKIRFESSRGKIKLEEVSDLEYVIESLAGRHTITIELLAHLACTKLWTIKRLKEELEKKGFQLQFHKNGELVNIQKSYEVLYDLSMLTEAEQNILEAFSIFPYIPLSAEICNRWLLLDAGVSEDDDTLMGLYQKGWLQLDMEQETYALHPVFAQFIYEKSKPRMKNHFGLIKSCQQSLKIPESGSVLECQQYIQFGEKIVIKLDMEKGMEWFEFMSVIAYLLKYTADYKKAEKIYEELIEVCKNSLEKNLNAINIYNDLACVYEKRGKYKKAQELCEKSIKIYESELGKNHPDTAAIYNNLAVIYERQGEYHKAREFYEKSIHIQENVLGKEHPDIAKSYQNLASLFVEQVEYKYAEKLYKKSLQIRESVLGENHLDTAASYNSLAALYEVQGKYEQAEKLYKKSLQIRENILGENHLDVAIVFHNLAGIYVWQKKYGKAIRLYKKSLQIQENTLGEIHPGTAKTYNNLAYVYKELENYERAEELYEKSLQIRKKVLGENHLDTAKGYYNLANMHISQKKYKNVLTNLLKAYRIFKFNLGLSHSYTQMVYKEMELFYTIWNFKGDFKQWIELQKKELD